MRSLRKLLVPLAAATALAGCGDDGKQTTSTPEPQPRGFTVKLGPHSVGVSVKSLPAQAPMRVDYDTTAPKPVTVRILNNGRQLNEVSIKKGAQIHVLLNIVNPGKLVVIAGGKRATLKLTQPA